MLENAYGPGTAHPNVEDVYDDRGNRIAQGGPNAENTHRDAVCYRTESGREIKYAAVYPGPVNVHQNVPLSQFAIAWELENKYVATQIAPVCTVDKRSDIYYILGKQGQETARTPTDETDRRAVGAVANEIQNVFDTATFTLKNRALRDFLPDEVASNADEILSMTQSITDFLMNTLEYRWDCRSLILANTAANMTNTATFATAAGASVKIKDGTTALRYNNTATNYIKAQTIINNFMKAPNKILMGLDAAQALQACPEVAGQVVYGLGQKFVEDSGWNDDATRGGLPPKFNGLEVIVAPHIQNTAKKGQTNTFSGLITNTLTGLCVQAPSRRTLNTITTFRKGGIEARTYRDEGRRGMYIEVEMIQDEVVTNVAGGFLLTACVT